MIARIIAGHIDDGAIGALGIVQIREPICEAWTDMQQRRRWLTGHSGVSVGCAGADTFEEAEDRTESVDGVELLNDLHLGRTRIGKDMVDTSSDQAADETFSSVHKCPRTNV